MNKVILSGRICNDIELRQSSNGSYFTNITLAVKRNKDEADFIRVVAFDQSAEYLEKYCAKGDKLLIEGNISVKRYTNKSGSDVDYYSVGANRVELLATKLKEQ